MKEQPVQEVHFEKPVWVNLLTERLRPTECLCLNCQRLLDIPKCEIANRLYKVCVEDNVAMAITRCPVWKPKT